MTDLIQAAIKMGMSPDDIAVLANTPGSGAVDLGLSGPATRNLSSSVDKLFGLDSSPIQGPTASPYRDPVNYRTSPRGNRVGDGLLTAAGAYGDLSGQFYDGGRKIASNPTLRGLGKNIPHQIRSGARRMAGNAAGFLNKVPGMAKAGSILGVAAPALGAVGGVIGAGDIVLGGDSLANKGMDTLGMGIGGFIGAAGGPLGALAGAGIGKAVSDGAQFLLGGGQSAEERQLAEALLALKSGVI